MKNIKSFESWRNNVIDNSLFVSGRAKYNPKISNGVIKYKSGAIEPYYFAEIKKIGDKFICKIYKRKKDGSEIRLRNKLKKELRLAHNYVREFFNQKLKVKKKLNTDIKKDRIVIDDAEKQAAQLMEPTLPQPIEYVKPPKPKSKAIIRRFS